jgi:hypothetical protein
MNQCYLCGHEIRSDDGSRDHVPPKSLFPVPRPSDLITLPAHLACNQAYSADEEGFRADVAALANTGESQQSALVWEAVRRSHNRAPTKRVEMRKRLIPLELRTKAGLVVGRVEGLRLPVQRTDRVLIKIGKGLHAHFVGIPVSPGLVAHAFLNPETDETIKEIIRRSTFSRAFGDVFAYAGGITDEGGSFWAFTLYRKVAAIVAFTSRDPQEPQTQ